MLINRTQMFSTLTVRYSLIMMGGIALLLAPIPFVMFFKGPWIRDHSPYSKRLIAEEQKRLDESEISNLEPLAQNESSGATRESKERRESV